MFCVGVSYAQESSQYDCSLVASNAEPQKYANAIYQAFADRGEEPIVYTKKDLATVMLHLKQYCCEEMLSPETCSGLPKSNNQYAQSPYIFDHLLSIGMRKMDGVEDHCDEMDIDCAWEDGSREHIDWREEITELAEDRLGHPSYEIEGNFRKYWGQPGEYTEKEKLVNKYSQLCEEAVHIRQWLPDFNSYESDLQVTQQRGLLGTCNDMANLRYQREYLYVRALMVEK
ncbi:MAG: hypothetical protein H6765_04025 [Candidatus Peribacteria bacterium]|nr:MAG: hypothetical protein H6765_04025 [Candidatus Peribacteria bacterium]